MTYRERRKRAIRSIRKSGGFTREDADRVSRRLILDPRSREIYDRLHDERRRSRLEDK